MTSNLRKRVTAEVASVNDGLKTAPTLTDRQISHQTASTARALLAVPPGTMPTPGASLINSPVFHSVPVYDRTQWLWEYGGRTPAKGLENTSSFIHAKNGWREHYDKQLGWVALKPAAHAPFYVLSAHPAFKTVPVLVGFGSPDASFVGWDNGVSYHPALDANAASARHCKISHPTQKYNDNTVPGSPFAYRTEMAAGWCWHPAGYSAGWDHSIANLRHNDPISPGYSIKLLFNIQEYQGAEFRGTVSFPYNGHHAGEISIRYKFHNCNADPIPLGGACNQTWEDILALHGFYTGHWKRSSNDPSCGSRGSCSPYQRVNG